MKSKIFVILIIFSVFYSPAKAEKNSCGLSNKIEPKIFQLIADPASPMAQLDSGGLCKKIYFSREWLHESFTKKGIEKSIPENNFDRQVTAFKVTPNIIGFHLSSYEVQKSGSAQIALGRDIFFVYMINEHTIFKGIVSLGMTKRRQRILRCFTAAHSKFLLSDINKDGNLDIGILKEELLCKGLKNSEADVMEGPYYKQYPIQWYIFEKDHWAYHSNFDSRFPAKSYWRLPLIGILKSPIDYVMELTREPASDSD
ncbi:MAG: hypothetical protein ABUK01_12300 [Leptospirales bacterium]